MVFPSISVLNSLRLYHYGDIIVTNLLWGNCMIKTLTIYHGSQHIIEAPVYGAGRKNNDFGVGFYCTANKELAKEWAVSSFRDGFCNRYALDAEFLKVLKLNSPDYTVLNWMAVLVEHRLFALKTPVARRARAFLTANFSINVNAYDLIIGYRADDFYFDFAEAFLNNVITVEQLTRALRLGKLGEQIVLKSKYAFSMLRYEGCEPAQKDIYKVRRRSRDEQANQMYQTILEEETDGLFIQDIIREDIGNDDPRLPRNVSP